MTVLVTQEGNLIEAHPDAPRQVTPGGRQSLSISSMPFATWGSSQLTLIDGKPISYSQLYRTQVWIAVLANKLTRQIARLPLKVYTRNSQGERERVYTHRLVDLINKPAPRCASTQLKQWLILPTLLHGNSTLLKYRAERAGPPTRLWPLDWRFMQAIPRRGSDGIGQPFEFWRTTEFGRSINLDPENLLHLRWEAPDAHVGVSPLEQLGITVRVERSAQEYQQAYLQQGARPPSGIKLPEGVQLDSEQRAEMREDIAEMYAGSRNAGRPALLPGGAEWVSIAHNAHEAELIEQRKLTREEVAAVYDIPPPLIGILDKATFSNITEQHKMLFTTCLGPWLSLIEESFKAQVIDTEPAFQGLFVEFDLAEVLKGDKLKEINALKIAVQSGLLTLNEARQIQNLPRFDADWCDQPLIPANNLRSAPEPEPFNTDEAGDKPPPADEQAAAAAAASHNGGEH